MTYRNMIIQDQGPAGFVWYDPKSPDNGLYGCQGTLEDAQKDIDFCLGSGCA